MLPDAHVDRCRILVRLSLRGDGIKSGNEQQGQRQGGHRRTREDKSGAHGETALSQRRQLNSAHGNDAIRAQREP